MNLNCPEKSTSWAGVLGSGLNNIFQLEAHLEITNRSLLRILALSFLSLTIVKREAPAAKSFALDLNSFGKSLMQTRKRKWPNIEPWGTPAKAGFHDDVFPF